MVIPRKHPISVVFYDAYGDTEDLFSMEVSLYVTMLQNFMYHLEEGDFTLFDDIPIPTKELHKRRF